MREGTSKKSPLSFHQFPLQLTVFSSNIALLSWQNISSNKPNDIGLMWSLYLGLQSLGHKKTMKLPITDNEKENNDAWRRLAKYIITNYAAASLHNLSQELCCVCLLIRNHSLYGAIYPRGQKGTTCNNTKQFLWYSEFIHQFHFYSPYNNTKQYFGTWNLKSPPVLVIISEVCLVLVVISQPWLYQTISTRLNHKAQNPI